MIEVDDHFVPTAIEVLVSIALGEFYPVSGACREGAAVAPRCHSYRDGLCRHEPSMHTSRGRSRGSPTVIRDVLCPATFPWTSSRSRGRSRPSTTPSWRVRKNSTRPSAGSVTRTFRTGPIPAAPSRVINHRDGVACSVVPASLAGQTFQAAARRLPISLGCAGFSSHETSHGRTSTRWFGRYEESPCQPGHSQREPTLVTRPSRAPAGGRVRSGD